MIIPIQAQALYRKSLITVLVIHLIMMYSITLFQQKNVDIVLSVGGAISDILDYIFDKSINNVIWKFKLW